MTWKMPERGPADGPVAVNRPEEGKVSIHVTTDGELSAVTMTDYNACRIFAMLAVMLKIPLPPHLGKAIQLG